MLGGTETFIAVTYDDTNGNRFCCTCQRWNKLQTCYTLGKQQSIKAYVDSQVTAQDLDFQGDSGGALSIDLCELFTGERVLILVLETLLHLQ